MSALVSVEELPAVFSGVEDFEITPEGIEVAQATFNEEAIYQAITEMATDWFRNHGRPARILDLCSATGLCALSVSNVIPAERIVLVDIDAIALDVGMRRHFAKNTVVTPVCEDAVTYYDGSSYDLILMNSAYHHIENEGKVEFLRNAGVHLAPGGMLLVGDHFLPPYTHTRYEYRRSVIAFYSDLIRELEKRGESQAAIDVIRRAGLYCWQGTYEYKVCWERFAADAAASSLGFAERLPVWFALGATDECIVGSAVIRLFSDEQR